MKLCNKMLFCLDYSGQQAYGTASAQLPTHRGSSYHPLGDIFPPPAEDMIDDIREQLDDDGETWQLNQ